jgi:hypothetical protein
VLDRRLRLLDDRYGGDGGLFRGREVLDVGCNYGRVAGELGEAFFSLFGLWFLVFLFGPLVLFFYVEILGSGRGEVRVYCLGLWMRRGCVTGLRDCVEGGICFWSSLLVLAVVVVVDGWMDGPSFSSRLLGVRTRCHPLFLAPPTPISHFLSTRYS